MVYAALSAFNNNEALYTMDIYGSLWKDRWPSPNMVYTVINMAHGTKMGIPGQAAPDSKKISSNLHRGKSLWTIAIDPLKTGQHFPFLKHTMNDAELQPRNYLIFCFGQLHQQERSNSSRSCRMFQRQGTKSKEISQRYFFRKDVGFYHVLPHNCNRESLKSECWRILIIATWQLEE